MSVLISASTQVSNTWAAARREVPPESSPRRCQNRKLPSLENFHFPPLHRGIYSNKWLQASRGLYSFNKLFVSYVAPGPVICVGCQRAKRRSHERLQETWAWGLVVAVGEVPPEKMMSASTTKETVVRHWGPQND